MPADPTPPPAVVIIPALDEEASIGVVVAAISRRMVRAIVVVDNGSRDRTAERAKAAGATVVQESRRGYGRACLRGLEHCAGLEPRPLVVAFLDGDGSDDPSELDALLAPILEGEADLVVGSRTRGAREPGALLPQARIGNAIATQWIRLLTGVRFTDLGPFRAISWRGLERLGMVDLNYGWTIEMQLKAARAGLRCREVPARYQKRRGGKSKVTGTLSGTLAASGKILGSLIRYGRWKPKDEPAAR